jgi:hypothetical protein
MERHSISLTAVAILSAVVLVGCEQRKDATRAPAGTGDTNYHSQLANVGIEPTGSELASGRERKFLLTF